MVRTPNAYGARHDDQTIKSIDEGQPDFKNITNDVLKICNVVREKNYGSKMLQKKTGIVCGAKKGARYVYEPLLMYNGLKSK